MTRIGKSLMEANHENLLPRLFLQTESHRQMGVPSGMRAYVAYVRYAGAVSALHQTVARYLLSGLWRLVPACGLVSR